MFTSAGTFSLQTSRDECRAGMFENQKIEGYAFSSKTLTGIQALSSKSWWGSHTGIKTPPAVLPHMLGDMSESPTATSFACGTHQKLRCICCGVLFLLLRLRVTFWSGTLKYSSVRFYSIFMTGVLVGQHLGFWRLEKRQWGHMFGVRRKKKALRPLCYFFTHHMKLLYVCLLSELLVLVSETQTDSPYKQKNRN